jgi:hypothetical protein
VRLVGYPTAWCQLQAAYPAAGVRPVGSGIIIITMSRLIRIEMIVLNPKADTLFQPFYVLLESNVVGNDRDVKRKKSPLNDAGNGALLHLRSIYLIGSPLTHPPVPGQDEACAGFPVPVPRLLSSGMSPAVGAVGDGMLLKIE